ncbi:MAG: DUF4011 domain-containing protein [Myxococcaceae bacterium]
MVGDPDFKPRALSASFERVRSRLLDLSLRNQLLNYRFPQRGCVRLIDERIDFVHDRLLEGRTLTFEPIRAEFDEDLDATETADFEARKSAFKRRQDAAKEAAKRLGLDTSFDLQPSGVGPKQARHTDEKLQTLLFPVDLEAQLRKLGATARTALEETGSNVLYLACGFLEWAEREKEERRLAPLLLLPVQIEKSDTDLKTQTDVFRVRMREEHLTRNVSLEEKLRGPEFNLVLPERNEEASPERWLDAVAEFLKSRGSSWHVRRQLVLGTFSFGRLLMWTDLDTQRWSNGTQLVDHPLIQSVLNGGEEAQEEAGPLSEEAYNLEDPTLEKQLPPIVVDADSSQHSVLIDAAKGRSMVVQGPPGTGKSQTITNLIAGALALGKTVLFVTQKLAALEVVARRLREANLDAFCLQLHSHRTQKAEFLDDLRRRIALKPSRVRDSDTPEKAAELKRQLQTYKSQLHQPLEPLGRSPFEIFGAALRARQRIGGSATLTELRVPGATSLSASSLETLVELARKLGDALRTVTREDSVLARHPWAGVTRASLDRAHLVRQLKTWREAVSALRAEMETCSNAVAMPLQPSASLAASISKASVKLSDATGHLPALALASTRRGLQELRTLTGTLAATQNAWRALARKPPAFLSSATLAEIGGRLESSVRALPCEIRVDEIPRIQDDIRGFAADSEAGSRLLARVADIVGVRLSASVDSLLAISGVIEGAQKLSADALSLRSPDLLRRGARERLLALHERIQTLRVRSEELSKKYLPDLQPTDDLLKMHHGVVAASSWYSWLFADYRSARRAFASMAPTVPASREAMLNGFSALISFRAEVRDLEQDATIKELLAEHANGLKTPSGAALEAQRWATETRDLLTGAHATGQEMTERLLSADASVIERLSTLPSTATAEMGAIARLGATARQRPYFIPDRAMSIQAVRDSLDLLARRLADIAQAEAQLGSLEAETSHALATRAASTRNVMTVAETLARGPLFEGAPNAARILDSDISALLEAQQTAEMIWASTLPDALCAWLLTTDSENRLPWLREAGRRLGTAATRLQVAADQACSLGGIGGAQWRSDNLQEVGNRLDLALSNEPGLIDWLHLLAARGALADDPVGKSLVDPILQSPTNNAGDIAEAALFQTLADHALAERPALHRFQTSNHERIRAEFAATDRSALETVQSRIARQLLAQPITGGVRTGLVKDRTELGLIEHELQKQRGHVPIRRLIARAGKALQQLMPCFMMGPQSVAQYLPTDSVSFDLVIMDEASQMRPEDALGTLARGRQAIVVGDPKQLPPTSFFEAQGDDEEEVSVNQESKPTGKTGFEDAESILQAASGAFPNKCMLTWHYRSRHHSLIEYCNHRFYDGRLVVFPSPEETTEQQGVVFERVSGATYVAGSRVNEVEARLVAKAVAEHARRTPERSLVVVTLNGTQRELIERLIADAAKEDPLLARFIEPSEDRHEPFTVKNLENVQGDERDDVFISLTFGPDSAGRLVQNFGPINQENGDRRLNVLFTRARRALRVFCSFDPGELRVTDSSSAGLRVLSEYLRHAAKIGPAVDIVQTAKGPDSAFELAVADALRGRGLDVQLQVGVAGYFIDLGIRDPERPGVFALGVECDGDRYHRAKSARDRDRLRDAVLTGLGWKLHRVWATDWYRNSVAQTQRIVDAIAALRRAPLADRSATAVEIEERQHALNMGLKSSKHRREGAERGSVQAEPIDALDTTQIDPPPNDARPTAPIEPRGGPAPTPPMVPSPNELTQPSRPRLSLLEAIRSELPVDALTCATCGQKLGLRLSEKGPFLQCGTPACVRRRPVNFDHAKAAALRFRPQCDCGRPAKLINMGSHSFFGCTTHPECRNHYDWLAFDQRVGTTSP